MERMLNSEREKINYIFFKNFPCSVFNKKRKESLNTEIIDNLKTLYPNAEINSLLEIKDEHIKKYKIINLILILIFTLSFSLTFLKSLNITDILVLQSVSLMTVLYISIKYFYENLFLNSLKLMFLLSILSLIINLFSQEKINYSIVNNYNVETDIVKVSNNYKFYFNNKTNELYSIDFLNPKDKESLINNQCKEISVEKGIQTILKDSNKKEEEINNLKLKKLFISKIYCSKFNN